MRFINKKTSGSGTSANWSEQNIITRIDIESREPIVDTESVNLQSLRMPIGGE